MNARFLLLIFSILLMSLPAGAEENIAPPDLAPLFREAAAEGTFVLYRVADQTTHVHNPERAKTRFAPASTFKIVNAIIGLEAGSVANVDEILPYGGQPQFLKSWEKDMSLRDGMPISNVPIFQELARRTGLERMQSWLTKLEYGNADAGQVVDRFWLDGPLEISPLEQTQFLARLAQKQLPIDEKTFQQVSDITVADRGPGWVLHAKTGMLLKEGAMNIGWWVGWIEKEGEIYTFALNMDLPEISDGGKRIPLARKCLAALGVIPEPALPESPAK
ncbi:MAG TPA: class D beta-lactamase [Chthoniobacterales bacterium]|jgi:beta-lactamase class D